MRRFMNSPTPTLGGKQVWRDTRVLAGWRIQENVILGHCRLLDPGNIRRAWGDYESCRRQLDTQKQARGDKPRSTHLVILLHGIARSSGAFSRMEKCLREDGYDVVAISYPSTRGAIEVHASGVGTILNRLEGCETVSFVTHSMGGLVLRRLLAVDAPWMKQISLGRIVMIAPPNQGSAVAVFLRNFPPYKVMFGKSGQQLTPGAARLSPEIKAPFAIIAGGKNDGVGFNPFLDGDNDGTVTVAETALSGLSETLVIPAIHATISNHPKTIKATIRYLHTGRLAPTRRINVHDIGNI